MFYLTLLLSILYLTPDLTIKVHICIILSLYWNTKIIYGLSLLSQDSIMRTLVWNNIFSRFYTQILDVSLKKISICSTCLTGVAHKLGLATSRASEVSIKRFQKNLLCPPNVKGPARLV